MHPQGPRLWLVRHGETDWNVQRRVQGQTPTELNATGWAQAKNLARFFTGRQFAAAWSSDLPRAYQTADTIVANTGLIVQRTAGLRERSLGKYEGMLSSEVHAARTALGLEQAGDLADWTGMEGVETNSMLWERARKSLREISDQYDNKDVLVVAHGALMARVIVHVLGIADNFPRRFPLSNGMIVVLQWRVDAFYLLSLLDVPLLETGLSTIDTSATKSA
jgi:broad specificity phosphatase PhoE